jgi:tyrosinase
MTIITAGASSPNDSVVARQDLRDLIQDQTLFNLYLLALQRFQQVDQQDLLSWYRISGIHGRPYLAYDGVQGVGNFGGYCTHSSILFPTW